MLGGSHMFSLTKRVSVGYDKNTTVALFCPSKEEAVAIVGDILANLPNRLEILRSTGREAEIETLQLRVDHLGEQAELMYSGRLGCHEKFLQYCKDLHCCIGDLTSGRSTLEYHNPRLYEQAMRYLSYSPRPDVAHYVVKLRTG